jgi:hypothetical protein
MAFVGTARGGLETTAPASVWRLACGLAGVASGAIWVWLARG